MSLAAPAKINLGLKITGRRPDGYHDLQSLMVPLSIGDQLSLEALDAPGAWAASCDHPDVPVGEGSLVEKAFRFAAKALGYAGGMSLALKKVIPMGAGLGGGSSDAAAVMRAVERFTGRQMPADLYSEVAYQVGADVPFFLKDGAKWVMGIGEQVRPLTKIPPLNVLLVHPGVGIATKWVYSQLKIESLTPAVPAATLPAVFESLADLVPYLANDLESVVLPASQEVREAKEALKACGADTALMSGSGSTVYGLYSDPKKLKQAAEALKSQRPPWWMCSCSSVG
ncbi:MAG TPA: 4-(cytidine 5'-diphospho)-2-C-methyl-D-erythritol kinase [bacterium]|nr:4-(cytidine 5'-diphospho)-2-C-methyl-D-erythritol kinase [bacterium]